MAPSTTPIYRAFSQSFGGFTILSSRQKKHRSLAMLFLLSISGNQCKKGTGPMPDSLVYAASPSKWKNSR